MVPRIWRRVVKQPDKHGFFVCIICVEFEKGRMTAKEARRALGEMVPKVGDKHSEEVERVLREAEEKAAAAPHKP
jgi:hypothetical protein